MYDHDKPEVLKLLKDHFPKATDSDGLLVWDAVKGYALADAKHGIEKHRIEQGRIIGRPDINRVRTLAASAYRERNPRQVQERIWDAVCRGRYPGHNRIADLMAHFGGSWDEVKTSGCDDVGKHGVRALILHSARLAFRQEGMDDKDAEDAARDVVELRPGERVSAPLSALLADAMPEVPKPANGSAAKARAIAGLGGGLPPVAPPAPKPAAPSALCADDFTFDEVPSAPN